MNDIVIITKEDLRDLFDAALKGDCNNPGIQAVIDITERKKGPILDIVIDISGGEIQSISCPRGIEDQIRLLVIKQEDCPREDPSTIVLPNGASGWVEVMRPIGDTDFVDLMKDLIMRGENTAG